MLLLCDGCDGAIHTYCCTPPLAHAPQGCCSSLLFTESPAGDFYCESCGHLRSEDEAAKQQELLAGAGTSGEDSGAATRSRDKRGSRSTRMRQELASSLKRRRLDTHFSQLTRLKHPQVEIEQTEAASSSQRVPSRKKRSSHERGETSPTRRKRKRDRNYQSKAKRRQSSSTSSRLCGAAVVGEVSEREKEKIRESEEALDSLLGHMFNE